jgi:arylformamidase
MVTYPGLPGPEVADHMSRQQSQESYAPGVTFNIGRIAMVGNPGTYIDSPFHRYEEGVDLAGLNPELLLDVPAVVVDPALTDGRAVDVDDLEQCEATERAVLIRTRWDRHWGTAEYGREAPYLSAAGAQWLVEHSAAIVGIDSVNIDDPADPLRPAHSILLGAGIPIVEHLCRLESLPAAGFTFTAIPAPIRGFSSFPVRALAMLSG